MTLLYATLRVWTVGAYTADVELTGGRGYYVTGVPVSRSVPSAEMTTGRTVWITTNDVADVGSWIIFAVR